MGAALTLGFIFGFLTAMGIGWAFGKVIIVIQEDK